MFNIQGDRSMRVPLNAMELGERGFCFRTMETVTKSPIGNYAFNEITKYSKLTKSHLTFDIIYSKIDHNQYHSITEWYDDMWCCVSQVIKIVGKSTPFGLVCLTLLQHFNDILNNKAKAILQQDSFQNKQKNRRLRTIIDDTISVIPNTQREMPNAVSQIEPFERKIFPRTKETPIYGPDEIADIYYDLAQIESDEEMQNIMKVTTLCERLNPPKKGVLNVDLSQVSPFTLELIRKHLQTSIH